MDPLSIIASVAGVATATFQIIGIISQIKSGGKDRLRLCQEITHLWLSITSLQQQLAPDSIVDNKIPQHLLPLFATDGIIHDIEVEVKRLEDKLKVQSTRGKIRQTLAWPFTQQDVLQAIERVHRLQHTLHLALTQSTHSLTQDIYRDGQAVKQTIDEGRKREIIQWLTELDFLSKQKQIFGDHHEGTCKWFLERREFRQWRHGRGTVLFGPGIPGAGKTFLSSIVVHELERLRDAGEGGVEDAAVVSLYCKWDDSRSQSVDTLIASVLKQIIQKYPVLTQDMVDKFSKHIVAGTRDQNEIKDVLMEALKSFPKVFIVVDGLDELSGEKDRGVLLKTLRELHLNANLMVTSRPLHSIISLFRGTYGLIYCDGCGENNLMEHWHCANCQPSFDLCKSCYEQGKRCGHKGHVFRLLWNAAVIDVTAVQEDLKTYVDWRIASSDFLQRCVDGKKNLGGKIQETVVRANGGMFLLAKFNMDTLDSNLNVKGVLAALKTLPKELDGTYADAMKRITALPENTKIPVMEFLRWVVFAKEPLSVHEIEHALAVCDGDEDIDSDNIIQARTLADKCAGLVVFDDWDCARLVHFSAQNYFNENHAQWFEEGETKLASTCLTYLLFDSFKSGACSGPSELADFQARLQTYPFLHYAAINWGKHLAQTPSDDLYKQAHRLLDDSGWLTTTTQVLWYMDDEDSASWAAKNGSSGLHLATHFGLSPVVEELLKGGLDPNIQDANGATGLMIAAERGQVEVARALIQAGASVNMVDNIGAAALLHAAARNHKEIVELLLEVEDIDVNIIHPRKKRYTPLHFAAKPGYADIIKLLLASPKLEVNKECFDPLGGTALMVAAIYGKEEAVQALLSHPGIDIDHQDRHGGDSALIIAAQNGHYAVVDALLDKGANTEVLQYGTLGTALMRAIDQNHIPVVQLLLDRGANVHHQDCFNRGMLMGAACNNRYQILRILLQFDNTLDINWQDVNGKTTLHDVARLSCKESAEVLLEYGADPTIKDNHGRTPIRIAHEMNNQEILDMLRRAREKQKARAGEGTPNPTPKRTDTGTSIRGVARTDTQVSVEAPLPLWALANAELTDELKARLEDKAARDEINVIDPDMGQSALHYMAAADDADLVRLLIEHGADLDLPNKYGRTPVHLTALGNCPDAADALIDAGADINIPDQWNCQPLVTAFYGRRRVATKFVQAGASLSDQRLDLNYLLGLAAMEGSEVAVRRLVEAGADVLRKNDTGDTPYRIAAFYRHEDLANLILQLGQQSASVAPTPPEVNGRNSAPRPPEKAQDLAKQTKKDSEEKEKEEEPPRSDKENLSSSGTPAASLKMTSMASGVSKISPFGHGMYILLMILVAIAATMLAR